MGYVSIKVVFYYVLGHTLLYCFNAFSALYDIFFEDDMLINL